MVDDLVLCVEEAATNAIRHSGTGSDIEISLQFDADHLLALVKDSGRGFDIASFDPQHIPDPALEHGRGLFIVASLMDSLELRVDGGLEVHMLRKVARNAGSAPLESGLGEPQLGHSEARTRAFLEEIDKAFVALDWEYRYVHANQTAVRMLGKSHQQLLGGSLWELFPQLQSSPLGEHVRNAMELGRPSVSEQRSVVSDGWLEVRIYPTSVGVSVYYRPIDERKRAELERETTIGFLRLVNESDSLRALVEAATSYFQRQSGCEAVGIRLRDGDDYPYFETRGFSAEFVALETKLCARDADGRLCRDGAGAPLMECMCGNVICGRTDSSQEFFSEQGSFWSNSTTELLATTTEEDRQARTRNRCNGEGYESVALIPLRIGGERLGLLQLNDRRKGRFAAQDIALWERLADQLAVAVAKLQLDEQLHESQDAVRRQAELLDLSFEPIIVWRLGGGIESWNRGAAELYGYPSDEALGRVTHELLGTRHPRSWARIEAALRKHGSWKGELVHHTKDGREVIVLTRHQLVHGSDGIDRVLESNRDITARRQVEKERQRLLEESQAQAEELHVQGEELQTQNEELQAQGEELQVQAEEMQVQNQELLAQRDLTVRESELRAGLNAIAALLHSTLEPDEVVRRTLGEATRVLAVGAAAIELNEGDTWPVRYAEGLPSDDLGRPLMAEPVIARFVALTGEALVLDDATRHETVGPFAMRHGIRSLIAVPLAARKQILGVLVLVERRTAHHFEPAEVDFARRLGTTVGLALENARLFEAEVVARRQVKAELQTAGLLLETAATLASWTELGAMLESLGDLLLQATDHSRVLLELWDEERQEVEIAASRGSATTPRQRFKFDGISDAAKQVIATKESVVIDYAETGLPAEQKGYVDKHAFLLMLVVPIVYRGRLVGLITADQPGERRPFSPREIELVEAIAGQAGAAIENARLRAREAEAARLGRALNELDSLINSTLDAKEIMQIVVERAVAAVGTDSAMVALRHGEDWVAEYGYPEVPGVIHESVRTEEAPFMMAAVAQRQPIAIDDCETDPRCLPEVQRRFGVRSVLCIPLIVREEVLGVIFFNHHRAAVAFPAEIVDFATKLATAISTALANARLYDAQRRIATTLQENFVHQLPQVAGLELGAVAQTAYEAELVGGDFSDVFLVDDDHVMVLIGDVAGKGVRAAGMTETVRSTVRALAAVDRSPAFILGKTNELLLRFDPDEPHVTAFLAVLEPKTGHLSYASAGHPAPAHLGAFSCQTLEVAFGPPLGTFEHSYANAHATLTLDTYLVLYTDGVTEARRGAALLGEKRLLEVVADLRGGSAQEVAAGVRDAALAFAGRLRDDLQVVVLRLA